MNTHKATALTLPRGAKELLIEHIDGPNFINVPVVAGDRVASRTALLDRELIRHDSSSLRPTSTVITEDGRYVLAIILAQYAEALIRAGYGVEAEISSAIQADIAMLFEEHAKTLPPLSDRSGASPSPAKASAPVPAILPQPQTVSPADG